MAAAYGDGSASTYSLEDYTLTPLHHWKENRLKANQRYVGLSIASQFVHLLCFRAQLDARHRGIFTCTSNGALRMTPKSSTELEAEARTALLPTRLHSWKLAADQETFAYGVTKLTYLYGIPNKRSSNLQCLPPQTSCLKRGNEILISFLARYGEPKM